ncbi:MAG: P-II family nitrogen regulator [Terracidiphilus sp.]|nr:P-II family nitrogen regulator [Terracidiphilus sp.]
MKEIIAIIRPKKVGVTRNALVELGYTCLTGIAVKGRGNQFGIADEIGVQVRLSADSAVATTAMRYVPKRLLSVIVPDAAVDKVKDAIVAINQTGQIGDGKIFICPVDTAIRVRTGEVGEAAI